MRRDPRAGWCFCFCAGASLCWQRHCARLGRRRPRGRRLRSGGHDRWRHLDGDIFLRQHQRGHQRQGALEWLARETLAIDGAGADPATAIVAHADLAGPARHPPDGGISRDACHDGEVRVARGHDGRTSQRSRDLILEPVPADAGLGQAGARPFQPAGTGGRGGRFRWWLERSGRRGRRPRDQQQHSNDRGPPPHACQCNAGDAIALPISRRSRAARAPCRGSCWRRPPASGS